MLGDRSSRVKITVRYTEVRRIVETLRNWSGLRPPTFRQWC